MIRGGGRTPVYAFQTFYFSSVSYNSGKVNLSTPQVLGKSQQAWTECASGSILVCTSTTNLTKLMFHVQDILIHPPGPMFITMSSRSSVTDVFVCACYTTHHSKLKKFWPPIKNSGWCTIQLARSVPPLHNNSRAQGKEFTYTSCIY